MPTYPGTPPIRIRALKQIAQGDSNNTYLIELPNHTGTHIDTPNHFDDNGRKIASFQLAELIFEKPLLVQIEKDEGQLFFPKDFEKFEQEMGGADFLLIRTGFESQRLGDAGSYSNRNPGFSAEGAAYVARRFGNLRGIGFDFVSLSSVLHREEGRAAHRVLLVERDFVIVEDMHLSELATPPKRVFVIPLFLEGVDGTPCTVVAEI